VITCRVSSVDPVSTIDQQSMNGRTERKQRSITLLSSFTIIAKQTLGRPSGLATRFAECPMLA
jgi:hypothetical protein